MNITGFNPNNGGVGTNVTLSLTDMPTDADDGNTSVFLSGDPTVTVNNVVVDNAGNGTVDLTIEQNAQSGDFVVIVNSPSEGWQDAQSAQIFTVQVPAHEPQITNLNPREATAGQTQVTLSGQNLDEISYVRIGNTTIMNIQHIGNTMIRFRVPNGVQTGQQRVYGQSQQYGRVNCPYMLTVQ